MATNSTRPTVKTVRVTDAHAPVVAEFFRQVWDPDATPESVSAGRAAEALANPALRGKGDIPTYLLLSDDRVLGYVSTIPVRVWLPATRETVDAAWVKGLMVLPEHRNGPIGVLVAKELVRHHPILLALTVQSNARRLFTALGFRAVGDVPTAMRILDPTAVLRSLNLDALGLDGIPKVARHGVAWIQRLHLALPAGAVVRTGIALRNVGAPRGGSLRIRSGVDPTADELDRLWNRARSASQAEVIRDAAYLTYRYRGADATSYTTVSAHQRDGTLAGVAYIKHPRESEDPRLRGIRIATLSDIVFPSSDAAVAAALVRASERVARRIGAHAILSSASVEGLGPLLRRRTWLGMPATFGFFTHDVAGTDRFPASLEQWWLTRGDGGSDGGL